MLSRRSLLRGGGTLAVAAAAGLAATPVYGATRSTADWERLRSLLQGDVVTPGDATYGFAKQGILMEFDSINPQGIVYAETPADVSTAIRFARDAGLPARVRSGGHNLAGWSIGEGMILDVSRINHATPGSTVHVGPGAQSIDAITALKPYNQQIVSGTCPTVCPGGFLSGGGIGLQLRKFGTGSDRVVSARLVLADGRVVQASATENPDLYWAIRGGGGNNFGVVVDFEIRPISAPRMVFYNTMWPYEKAQQVITAWQQWTYNGSDNLGSVLQVFLPDGAQGNVPMVQITGGYFGTQAALETALNDLASAAGTTPTLRAVRDQPYDEAMKAVYGCEQITVRECHRVGTNPDATLQRAPFLREQQRLTSRPFPATAVADLLTVFETDRRAGQARNLYFMALGGKANQPCRTESAYVHRDAHFMVVCATLLFNPTPPAEEAAAAHFWPERGFAIIDPLSTGETYVNFPNPERTDWRESYYAENYPRLVTVKKRFDPSNFFNHPQSVGS